MNLDITRQPPTLGDYVERIDASLRVTSLKALLHDREIIDAPERERMKRIFSTEVRSFAREYGMGLGEPQYEALSGAFEVRFKNADAARTIMFFGYLSTKYPSERQTR